MLFRKLNSAESTRRQYTYNWLKWSIWLEPFAKSILTLSKYFVLKPSITYTLTTGYWYSVLFCVTNPWLTFKAYWIMIRWAILYFLMTGCPLPHVHRYDKNFKNTPSVTIILIWKIYCFTYKYLEYGLNNTTSMTPPN